MKKKKSVVNIRRLEAIIKKYGKVRITCEDISPIDEYNWVKRQRLITANGACSVRYRDTDQDEHHCTGCTCKKPKEKYSRYSRSCFMDYLYETYDDRNDSYKQVKQTLRGTLKALFEHDKGDGVITAVYVGEGFKRKLI